MKNIFTFNKDYAPAFIKILFYLGLLGLVLGTISFFIGIAQSIYSPTSFSGWLGYVIYAIISLVIGYIILRVIVEFLLAIFSIKNSLLEIKNK